MYKVKLLCYDIGSSIPTEEEPNFENEFENYEDAYAMAYNDAMDLCEYLMRDLNTDFDGQISFGIAEYGNNIYVNYYCLDSENDTTGNTEVVQMYFITEV